MWSRTDVVTAEISGIYLSQKTTPTNNPTIRGQPLSSGSNLIPIDVKFAMRVGAWFNQN